MCEVFFFNDTATTEIYTLSLHDALPIWDGPLERRAPHARLAGELLRQDVPRRLVRRERRRAARLRRHARDGPGAPAEEDWKSTRLNSRHANISYAVFCLKKKTQPRSLYS